MSVVPGIGRARIEDGARRLPGRIQIPPVEIPGAAPAERAERNALNGGRTQTGGDVKAMITVSRLSRQQASSPYRKNVRYLNGPRSYCRSARCKRSSLNKSSR